MNSPTALHLLCCHFQLTTRFYGHQSLTCLLGLPVPVQCIHSSHCCGLVGKSQPYSSRKQLNQTTQFPLIDLHWLLPALGMKSQVLLDLQEDLAPPPWLPSSVIVWARPPLGQPLSVIYQFRLSSIFSHSEASHMDLPHPLLRILVSSLRSQL